MSKLKEIADYGFAGCNCFPRLVCRLTGARFARSAVNREVVQRLSRGAELELAARFDLRSGLVWATNLLSMVKTRSRIEWILSRRVDLGEETLSK
jgi:hypothetical protein